MRNICTISLTIITLVLLMFCIKVFVDAALPEYTVIYQLDYKGNKVALGVQDNDTLEMLDPTPDNLKLSKGDIMYVSPLCVIHNKQLTCK